MKSFFSINSLLYSLLATPFFNDNKMYIPCVIIFLTFASIATGSPFGRGGGQGGGVSNGGGGFTHTIPETTVPSSTQPTVTEHATSPVAISITQPATTPKTTPTSSPSSGGGGGSAVGGDLTFFIVNSNGGSLTTSYVGGANAGYPVAGGTGPGTIAEGATGILKITQSSTRSEFSYKIF